MSESQTGKGFLEKKRPVHLWHCWVGSMTTSLSPISMEGKSVEVCFLFQFIFPLSEGTQAKTYTQREEGTFYLLVNPLNVNNSQSWISPKPETKALSRCPTWAAGT